MTFNNKKKPFIIGVCGGSSSGKVQVCCRIKEEILLKNPSSKVVILNSSSFFVSLESEKDKKLAKKGNFNFDCPNAFDFNSLYNVLLDVTNGKSVTIYSYDKVNWCRSHESPYQIDGDIDVLLVEGILIFYDEKIRKLFNLKLFVDRDPDTRLCRRIRDDLAQKGLELTFILDQYKRFIKPAFEEFCLPTKKYADVIIPRGEQNEVAIAVIAQHLNDLLSCQIPAVEFDEALVDDHSILRDRNFSGSQLRPH